MSPDGRTVAVYGRGRVTVSRGAVKTELPPLAGDQFVSAGEPTADGRVLVGSSSKSNGRQSAVYWTDGVITARPGDGDVDCSASHISSTQGVELVLGSCGSKIVRWRSGELQVIGEPEGTEFCTQSLVFTADGSRAFCSAHLPGAHPLAESPGLYTWTEASGFQEIAQLPHKHSCAFHSVNANAEAVGSCANELGRRNAIYWTVATGMIDLGQGHVDYATANAIAADAPMIVGRAGDEGALWDRSRNFRRLRSFISDSGVTLPDWSYFEASSISEDGKTIAGYSVDADSIERAWVFRMK